MKKILGTIAIVATMVLSAQAEGGIVWSPTGGTIHGNLFGDGSHLTGVLPQSGGLVTGPLISDQGHNSNMLTPPQIYPYEPSYWIGGVTSTGTYDNGSLDKVELYVFSPSGPGTVQFELYVNGILDSNSGDIVNGTTYTVHGMSFTSNLDGWPSFLDSNYSARVFTSVIVLHSEFGTIEANNLRAFSAIVAEQELDVKGTFKYIDGGQGAGKMLISDSSGTAHWAGNNVLMLNSFPQWIKFHLTYADFAVASNTNTVIVTTLPPKADILTSSLRWTTPFTGPSITSYTINAITYFTQSFYTPTVISNPVLPYSTQGSGVGMMDDTGYDDVTIDVGCDQNLDTATQGELDLWLLLDVRP